MSKVAILATFPQIFLTTYFLETPKFFKYPPKFFTPPPPKIVRPPQIFFALLDLEILFLEFIDLKNVLSPKKASFLDLKNFFRLFRPKNPFLTFLDQKIPLNPLKTLKKHLFNLQSDEKNNIFFRLYSKKLP